MLVMSPRVIFLSESGDMASWRRFVADEGEMDGWAAGSPSTRMTGLGLISKMGGERDIGLGDSTTVLPSKAMVDI